MKALFTSVFAILFTGACSQPSNEIYTSDIDNFWMAFDSIQKATEYSEKIEFINQLYINKGTKGLKAFMEARNYTDTLYVNLIDKYPKFWNSIRPNTLSIKSRVGELNKAVLNLKKLYPDLKDADMYFTIGGLRSGGTVKGNMTLVGAEIAMGNPSTDVSEFKKDWLKNVFSGNSPDHLVQLNVPELVHTQQRGDGGKNTVLKHSIMEGSCDFIAELATEQPVQTKYLTYGRANAREIKELFKKEMFSENLSNWLYNGPEKVERADLGYYIGYEICKAYYENAKNKAQAIKDIIELNYSDDRAVENFLITSRFYN